MALVSKHLAARRRFWPLFASWTWTVTKWSPLRCWGSRSRTWIPRRRGARASRRRRPSTLGRRRATVSRHFWFLTPTLLYLLPFLTRVLDIVFNISKTTNINTYPTRYRKLRDSFVQMVHDFFFCQTRNIIRDLGENQNINNTQISGLCTLVCGLNVQPSSSNLFFFNSNSAARCCKSTWLLKRSQTCDPGTWCIAFQASTRHTYVSYLSTIWGRGTLTGVCFRHEGAWFELLLLFDFWKHLIVFRLFAQSLMHWLQLSCDLRRFPTSLWLKCTALQIFLLLDFIA